MQVLAPQAAYDVDDTGFFHRFRYVGGGVFGICMAIVTLAQQNHDRSLQAALATSIGTGALSGALFGVGTPWALRRVSRSLIARLYDADPALVGAAPTDGRYSARLPCTYVKSHRLGIGGVLFVGPGALLFVPHRRNLAVHRAPFTIDTTYGIATAIRLSERGVIARLLTARPAQLLEFTAGTATYRFLVPAPRDTARAVERILAPAEPA